MFSTHLNSRSSLPVTQNLTGRPRRSGGSHNIISICMYIHQVRCIPMSAYVVHCGLLGGPLLGDSIGVYLLLEGPFEDSLFEFSVLRFLLTGLYTNSQPLPHYCCVTCDRLVKTSLNFLILTSHYFVYLIRTVILVIILYLPYPYQKYQMHKNDIY